MKAPVRLHRVVLALFLSTLVSSTSGAATETFSVSALAGTPPSSGYADGRGTSAAFFFPTSVAADRLGNIFVADAANQVIRKIDRNGTVSTLAGRGGEEGDNDGPALSARFRFPNGVGVDSGGNVFVADTDNCTIRRIAIDGMVSTVAGLAGLCGAVDGAGSTVRFSHPTGLVVDGDGTIFVADRSNHTIRRIALDGFVSTFAGSAGQPGSLDGRRLDARFAFPFSLTIDPGGTLYVADTSNHTIRRITLDGTVTTICGMPEKRGAVDGPCATAKFDHPSSVAIDSTGDLYISESEGGTIRRVSPDGMVGTIAGISGVSGYRDGSGPAAAFSHPFGITVDSDGTVIIADTYNHTIRAGTSVEGSSRRRPVRR